MKQSWLEPITLSGQHCTLVPLSLAHGEALMEAVKDGELWQLWHASVPAPEEMQADIERRLSWQQQGVMLPFTVLDAKTQQPIGMTSYSRVDVDNRRLDIGFTWYAKRFQKTLVNTEAKQLLLTHAFETLDCIAVGFRVDFLNHVSRLAVERLGAKLDGVIRHYSILSNGQVRDMCFYSILPHEWPHIKTHLDWLLTKPR